MLSSGPRFEKGDYPFQGFLARRVFKIELVSDILPRYGSFGHILSMGKEFLMRGYLLLAAIGANITSNYLLKRAASGPFSSVHDLLNPFLVFGVGFAALTLIAYTFALREFPLSVAYPVVTTMAYLGVFLISWLALGEQIPPLRLLGAGLVLVGIVCMALSVDGNSQMQTP